MIMMLRPIYIFMMVRISVVPLHFIAIYGCSNKTIKWKITNLCGMMPETEYLQIEVNVLHTLLPVCLFV